MFFQRLQQSTEASRQSLFGVPVIVDALQGRITREQYVAFLTEAYHHVKHTVPLLMACGSRLAEGNASQRASVAHYIKEEIGHEEWILKDIAACGGDPEAVRAGRPGGHHSCGQCDVRALRRHLPRFAGSRPCRAHRDSSGMSGHPYRVVLTGAAGGIGQELALALAQKSSAMLLVGRDADKLSALRQRLPAAREGLSIDVLPTDLTSYAGRESVANAARALRGGVNLLVNNAAVSDFHAFQTQSAPLVESMLATNLLSPILLCQKLLPLLLTQPAAQIVNLGSVFGDIGYPGFAVYCASKSGLRGFTQALRRELSDTPVRARYFAPRATQTGLNSPAVEAMNAELKTQSDDPAVVAQACMSFLAGTRSEQVVGWPEKLFVLINRLRSSITDDAIAKRLAVIKRHLPT